MYSNTQCCFDRAVSDVALHDELCHSAVLLNDKVTCV